ncbi:hypothetical protein FHY26_002161 [Xanthomonas campestris]
MLHQLRRTLRQKIAPGLHITACRGGTHHRIDLQRRACHASGSVRVHGGSTGPVGNLRGVLALTFATGQLLHGMLEQAVRHAIGTRA